MEPARQVKPHGRRQGVSTVDRQATMQVKQDEVRQWERDWRSTVAKQQDDTAKTLADVVGVVREMQGDVKELLLWKRGIETRKDERIEKVPDNRRADTALAVSFGMLAIYVLQLLSAHWH